MRASAAAVSADESADAADEAADICPGRLAGRFLCGGLRVDDGPGMGDEQGARHEQQETKEQAFETADEPGVARPAAEARMRQATVAAGAPRRSSPHQRNRSVRMVTVLVIELHPPGRGRRVGLSPRTSSTTCWRVNLQPLEAGPGGSEGAQLLARLRLRERHFGAGSGDSATSSAARAATAVKVEVAYRRTSTCVQKSSRVITMRNPTRVPTTLVPRSRTDPGRGRAGNDPGPRRGGAAARRGPIPPVPAAPRSRRQLSGAPTVSRCCWFDRCS